MLEKLSSSLRQTLAKISGAMFVDDALIAELTKDLQRALLQSDVNVKLVMDLTNGIKSRIRDTPKGVSKKDYLVKVIYDELVAFLGGEGHKITVTQKPFIVMLVGLFGSGKTTHAGKLARFFSLRGQRVAVLGLDVHRPGAMDQLEQLAGKLNVPCMIDKQDKNVLSILRRFKPELAKYDIVIVDTAGRDALSEDLIREINAVHNALQPQENLLVISADIGQTAERQAQAFHDACAVTGVIITKMDGTAKGGGALSACAITKAPVKFIGVGEKLEDLEAFDPKRFVGRMLGMGDLETLLEKVDEVMDKQDAEDLGKRFLKGEFNLLDLYEQMEAMSKMGPLGKVMDMIPGFSQLQLPKDVLAVQEGKLKEWKIAMQSMTKEELEDPSIISSSRIERISIGSGVEAPIVRELIKQYRHSKKLVRQLKGMGAGNPKQMQKLMRKMGMNASG